MHIIIHIRLRGWTCSYAGYTCYFWCLLRIGFDMFWPIARWHDVWRLTDVYWPRAQRLPHPNSFVWQSTQKLDVPKGIVCFTLVFYWLEHCAHTILVVVCQLFFCCVKKCAWKTPERAYIRVQTCPNWKTYQALIVERNLPTIQLLWIHWVT